MTGTRRRVLLLVVLVAVLGLALPGPSAGAHAFLLASTPPSGYAVETSPTEVTLDFDEPVGMGSSPLELVDAAGRQLGLGAPMLSVGARRLSASVSGQLAHGGYRIRWEVIAQDGDLVSGTITFAVGTGAVLPVGQTSGATSIDSPIVIVLRWVLFSGLALALGGAVGDWLTRRVLAEARIGDLVLEGPRPWVLVGAGLGALAAVGLALEQVGLDLGRLTATTAGWVLIVEAAGFLTAVAIAVLAELRRGSVIRVVAGVPLLAVVAAEGVRAHPHADAAVLGTSLTIVHVLAVTVWVGALVHVLRAARRWRRQLGCTRLLVYDYARLALVLVLLVVATGTAEAVVVLPSLDSLIDSTYGRVLLAKLALVAVVVVLAALARRRLGRSRRTPTVHPLGPVAGGEAAILVAVLAVTAVLVSVAPARPASTELAAPPAVTGLVVPAGTLAGQLTVIATASTGQLVVRMTTPGRDDLGSDNGPSDPSTNNNPTYRVSGSVTPDGQDPRTLTLRGCGAGCFSTPVAWRAGLNHLRLTIAAAPWHGGVADLDIPWPPHTDSHLLPNTLTAMRTVAHLVIHEAVTSDYAGYPGTEQPLSLSGADFLATEPYGNGGVTPVVLATTDGETEIGLAFPQGLVIRMFIGTDDRILREEYITPNHLITRTFEYPP
ncbi:MAG: copper resistance protein CopC [Actinomycetota bacterium]|nr:copper resistance protein CopC [Actinomycetota bacterium]